MVLKKFWRNHNLTREPLEPDEIFLDDRNLPKFDTQQFEGRLERPIKRQTFYLAGAIFIFIALGFGGRVFTLQVLKGEAFATRAESNSLRHTAIFPERGIIYDRTGTELAWNDPTRVYNSAPGLAHVLGYVGFPTEEEIAADGYDPKELVGREGLEKLYDQFLGGQKGLRIEEVAVNGEVKSDHLLSEPKSGESIVSSIDAKLQAQIYERLKTLAEERGFKGGAAIMMDIRTGEIIALTSYPEYDPNVLAAGTDREKINYYLTHASGPFLNRAISGLYTPGSIIKPFIATGVLEEKIIDPLKTIVSTGELSVPNPYDPKNPSIFKDWKAHGAVDMRHALAVSSNVYFYEVGGGFGQSQPGLGITKINEYARLFGFGASTGIKLAHEAAGVIPSPAWKEENFPGEPWRLGDTYHTAIGQYGFLVTPLQVVRAVAVVATGRLIEPTLLKADQADKPVSKDLGFKEENLQIVREGMRLSAQIGTAKGLNVNTVEIAAKTGTAELGTLKEDVNSWVMGFWPYQHPHYAFAMVMEKGSRSNLVGSVSAMRGVLDWLALNAPEYLADK
ncbi:MAG: penicillin-binding transpeptidase domain-containing protein [bacterium]|nr:penicillin-binding transpeptidase domain-containing protein [bacterium]